MSYKPDEGFQCGGDATGSLTNFQVTKLKGVPAPTPTALDDGKVLTYNHTLTTYSLQTPAAGSVNITQVELDFGAAPTRTKTFTVTDATVSTSNQIIATLAADAATGKSQDENELDLLFFVCVAGSGQFTVYARSLSGPVVGKFKMNYVVG